MVIIVANVNSKNFLHNICFSAGPKRNFKDYGRIFLYVIISILKFFYFDGDP